MGFFDAIKNLTAPHPESEDFDEDDFSPASAPAFPRRPSGSYTDYASAPEAAAPASHGGVLSFLDRVRPEEPASSQGASAPAGAGYGARDTAGTGANLHLQVVKPVKFEDAAAVADTLRMQGSALLNLESVPDELAVRIIDFISGAAYVQGGRVRRVSADTYIVTPANVDVGGGDEPSGGERSSYSAGNYF